MLPRLVQSGYTLEVGEKNTDLDREDFMSTNPSYPMQTGLPVAAIGVDERATFIARTYMHLFGAILGFAGIEVFLFKSGVAETLARSMLGVNWLFILGGFVIVNWFASRVALSSRSLPTQYAALTVFVFAEAIIFVPLLYVAQLYAPGTIESAATVTLLAFIGLTTVAFVTRKDFSFLGGILRWGFIIALVLIVAGVLFGFELGTYFSVAMVGLAGAAILYDTSNVLRVYPEDRYVAAALALFASVALMFWYVLRLFLSSRD
jgi:FtsH-binding integral membrane protein